MTPDDKALDDIIAQRDQALDERDKARRAWHEHSQRADLLELERDAARADAKAWRHNSDLLTEDRDQARIAHDWLRNKLADAETDASIAAAQTTTMRTLLRELRSTIEEIPHTVPCEPKPSLFSPCYCVKRRLLRLTSDFAPTPTREESE